MPLIFLTCPPPALTRSALATLSESTPSSFTDIPPYLHLHQTGIRYTIEPNPFPVNDGFEKEGETELYITEGALSIYSSTTSKGLSIPFPHLTLHALSREPMRQHNNSDRTTTTNNEGGESLLGGGPCIYCQIDENVDEEGAGDDEEANGRRTFELILISNDSTTVDKIFETLSDCASMNPTPTNDSDPSNLFTNSSVNGNGAEGLGDGLLGGLDPNSMVYADENGNIVGPGLELLDRDFNQEVQVGEQLLGPETEVEQVESSSGRVRSDYVNGGETRKGPY